MRAAAWKYQADLATSEHLFDRSQELHGVEGFRYRSHCPKREGFFPAPHGGGGKDENGDVDVELLELPENLDPVQPRHHDVRYDEIRRVVDNPADGLLAVGLLSNDLKPDALQIDAYELTNVGVIIDQQYPRRHEGDSRAATA